MNDYASANSSNYNMPLQIKSQNFMANNAPTGPGAGGKTAQNQKELLNEYYRKKHVEEHNLKEQEMQILSLF